MKKEIVIFLLILLILTVAIHYKELLAYPIEHIKNLPNSSVYGLGYLHPFIFSLIVYVVLLIPRFIIKVINKKF